MNILYITRLTMYRIVTLMITIEIVRPLDKAVPNEQWSFVWDTELKL